MISLKLLILLPNMAAALYAQPAVASARQPHNVWLSTPLVEAAGQTDTGLPQRIHLQLAAILNSAGIGVSDLEMECEFQVALKIVRTGGEGSKGFGGLPSLDKTADAASATLSSIGKTSPAIASTISAAGRLLKRPKPVSITSIVWLTARDGRMLLDEPITAKSTTDDNLITTVLQTTATRVATALAGQPK